MNRRVYAGLCLSLIGAISIVSLSGCSNTADGMEKDTSKATSEASQGAKNVGAAVSLTPEIKSAIVANPHLKESGNVIDVDSTADTVVLSGHVKTEKDRAMAEDLARKILKDKGSTNTLKNELKVVP